MFVAGGVGTAPVYPQVKWLKEHGYEADVIIGTRSKETLIFEEEMKKFDTLDELNKKWYDALDKRDFNKMSKYTDKISEISKDLVKFSKIIDETKKIEELHNFIKENNSFDFAVGIDGALMKLD